MNKVLNDFLKALVISGIALSIAGCSAPEPKNVVKEAFDKHEITDLVKYYNKADKTQKTEYKLNFSFSLRDKFEDAIKSDIKEGFTSKGLKRWEELNKVAKFAAQVKDDDYSSEKQMAEAIEDCYKFRKTFDDGCKKFSSKYGISATCKLGEITRYVDRALSNSSTMFQAYGYNYIFGKYIPDYDEQECILDFSKVEISNLKRGVSRFFVYKDGTVDVKSDNGFRSKLDKYVVVPKEAFYMKNEMESYKAQMTHQFNTALRRSKNNQQSSSSSENKTTVSTVNAAPKQSDSSNKRRWKIVDSNTERVAYVDRNSIKSGANDRVYFTMKVRRRDDGSGSEQDKYIDQAGYVTTLALRRYDSNWVLRQEIVDGSKFKSVKVGDDDFTEVYTQVVKMNNSK